VKANEIIKRAREEFAKLSKLSVNGVIGLSKVEEGWVILLEALEKGAIPDSMDVLGVYEIRLDNDGNPLGFDRKRLRKRGDTREE
jgi:hypothetical protein